MLKTALKAILKSDMNTKYTSFENKIKTIFVNFKTHINLD